MYIIGFFRTLHEAHLHGELRILAGLSTRVSRLHGRLQGHSNLGGWGLILELYSWGSAQSTVASPVDSLISMGGLAHSKSKAISFRV